MMSAILTITLNPAVDVYTSLKRISPTHKLRCDTERRDPGGGGINVARVVARLGGDVTAVFAAGGPIGDYLQQLVRAEGVPNCVVPISGVTRESFTVRETDTQSEYRFVLPGPSVSATEFEACLTAIGKMSGVRYIVASGGLPPGVPEDAHGRIARIANTLGAKFILDASGEPLRQGLEEGVYLVKPNLRELGDLVGEPIEDEPCAVEAARRLIASDKAEIVALSRGSDGATIVTADEAWTAPAVQVPVASSVGAGDSFLGGLVWSLERGDSLRAAFAYALAAGAGALLRPGTELCQAFEVEGLVAKSAVRAL
jgi:6-phosphofructokinase 2